jgi:hypothetical protein
MEGEGGRGEGKNRMQRRKGRGEENGDWRTEWRKEWRKRRLGKGERQGKNICDVEICISTFGACRTL